MRRLPHTRSCFVCGVHNPIGLKLDFETDDTIVRARFKPGPEHAGFRDILHGGLISTLLDEVMVWACGVRTGRFAYCAELTVRFLAPAVAGDSLTATGEMVENRRNRIFEASGRLENARGEIVAAATGKYIPIKEDVLPRLFEDFVDDTAGMFAAGGKTGSEN